MLTVSLARTCSSMFAVSGVLLVLERTGSAPLAGITSAAAVLPAALSGPVLGAWLDVARRRRTLIVIDQLTSVVALAAIAGGSILGTFALPGAVSLRRIALSYGILGASALLWPLAGTLAVGIVFVALTGVLEGPAYSGTIALRQRHTPPAVRAQLMTTVTSVAMASGALGSAVGGIIHDPLGVILAFTAVNAVAALVARGAGVGPRGVGP